MLKTIVFALGLAHQCQAFGDTKPSINDNMVQGSKGWNEKTTPKSLYPVNYGFTGGWGYSLLSPEEKLREPKRNELLSNGCSETENSMIMNEAAKKMDAMYDFPRKLDPLGQRILPEWKQCLGATKSAKEWQKSIGPTCIGPLDHLVGTWIGNAGKAYTAVPQYNLEGAEEVTFLEEGLGLVPGQPMGTFHAIKNQTYKELYQFSPILGNVKNRGYANADPINPKCQANQVTQGLKYILTVVQTSPDDADGSFGGILHEETGLIMYNSVPASGGGQLADMKLDRMATIPHGVSTLAEGTHAQLVVGKGAKEKMLAEQEATYLKTDALPLNCQPDDDYNTLKETWGTQRNGEPQPGVAPFNDLGPWLTNQTKQLKEVINYTHFIFATQDTSMTKFVKEQAEVVDYKLDFWLSKVKDEKGRVYDQLQYAQFSKFVFQQRFDCLVCEGGVRDEDGCYTSCEGMDQEYAGDLPEFMGKTLNEMPAVQHSQCYECKPDPKCEDQRGNGRAFWPHIQVNTLERLTKDTPKDFVDLFKGLDGFTSLST